ncbi:DUF359 domain-containing protein [archaeon]|nr:DUF359 domain-containing protein [archaeon]
MKYTLNERLRKELKNPIGPLVQEIQNNSIIVGDQCLTNALQNNKKPLLGIYDNLIKRKPTEKNQKKTIKEWTAKKITLDNPAGTITEKAITEIKKAIEKQEQTKIEINGEEDLLVIPCIIHAKQNTNIYYGQPNEGIVLVKATQQNKQKANKMLEEMRQ